MQQRGGFCELLEQHFEVNLPLAGIEIGCFKGDFAAHILNHCPELRLTSIDSFCYWDEVIGNVGRQIHRFRLLQLYSDEAAKILEGRYDFVFIDGDHSYEQCKKDILNYAPLVRLGGLVAGHNFHEAHNSAHPGVNKAVREIYGDRTRLQRDFIWYIKKEETDK